jgi:hypothetical protein
VGIISPTIKTSGHEEASYPIRGRIILSQISRIGPVGLLEGLTTGLVHAGIDRQYQDPVISEREGAAVPLRPGTGDQEQSTYSSRCLAYLPSRR